MNDQRSVMIVDDMPFMRSLLGSIIAMGGYTVVAEAVDGREAIELHRQHRPHITLMDANLPDMDGIEATQRIVADDSEARVVLCVISGHDDLPPLAMDSGIRGVVFKPFKAEQVLTVVQDVAWQGRGGPCMNSYQRLNRTLV